ncbi:hypothetical protein [Spirosoma luteum]|uniref:hypothetical protein n=1 Tax=Spirosoma luteum TaxID=431553 RepID=UPI0012F867D4|nr:hypothetical protein [Spirosoma luteum]
MATITLEIDDEKLPFFNDLIKHFTFVTIQETELDEDTDEQVKENIREGIKNMHLVEQGQSESRPAREFLTKL